jgi:plasmid stabilization system protein ParE
MASKRIEFHQDAAAEYDAAFDWYLARSSLAAQKFSDELDHAVENIAKSPHRWPRHLQGSRRFLLRHFPFAIIYRELAATIQVLAVAHGRRRPGYWKKRL